MVSTFRKIVENILYEGDKKIFDKASGYNSSKDELYIFDKLKEKYPNVIMSYTDDRFVSPETNRHWQADFYDPDSDTLFNYGKHIRHGRSKFNPNDPNHKKDVKWLESMPGDFYEKIRHTWTELDPLKREVAKQQGIDFIEWFNLDEFNTWFENPNLSYDEYKQPTSLQYNSDEYWDQKAKGKDTNGNDSDPYAECIIKVSAEKLREDALTEFKKRVPLSKFENALLEANPTLDQSCQKEVVDLCNKLLAHSSTSKK